MKVARKNFYTFLLLFFGLLFLVFSEYLKKEPLWRGDFFDSYKRFQNVFLEREEKLDNHIWDLHSILNDTTSEVSKRAQLIEHIDHFTENDEAFFVYRDGNLIFWSDNGIVVDPIIFDQIQNQHTFFLKNGWFFGKSYKYDKYELFGLFKIKNDYKYENRFLVNQFISEFKAPLSMDISPYEGVFEVVNNEGNFVFFISYDYSNENAFLKARKVISVLFGFLFIVFVLFFFYSFEKHIRKKSLYGAILFYVIGLSLFRFLLFYFHIPGSFYQFQVFNPGLYASSKWLPSLGDFLLHVIFFSFFCWYIYKLIKQENLTKKISFSRFIFNNRSQNGNILLSDLTYNKSVRGLTKKALFSIISAVFFLALLLLARYVIFLIKGLIINSSQNFDVNSIFQIDTTVLLFFLSMGLVLFCFQLLVRIVVFFIKEFEFSFHHSIIVLFVTSLISYLLIKDISFLIYLVVLLIIAYELLLRYHIRKNSSYSRIVVILFLLSIFNTLILYEGNDQKELEARKSIAIKLSSEQDPIAEFMYSEFEDELLNDSVFKKLIKDDPYNQDQIYKRLVSRYFKDYWLKYDVQLTLCFEGELLLVKPANYEIDCGVFFQDYIKSVGRPTMAHTLYYLDNNTGRNSYISRIPYKIVRNGEDKTVWLNIELDLKYIANDLGFPELLIDKDVKINRDLANYSYAIYRENRLINKYGNFPFSMDLLPYGNFNDQMSFFDYAGYNHLLFKKDAKTVILVSKIKISFFGKLAPFSYLFIFYCILTIAFFVVTGKFRYHEMFKLSFKRRVQFSMVGIVLISLILIGGGSLFYIYKIYENKNNSHLREKVYSVLTELEHKISNYPSLGKENEDLLYELLLKFSNVFFTDINLYDLNGTLIASSRPKIFEEGLLSKYMDPKAYFELSDNQKSFFIHNESIGKLSYQSAYIPFRNSANNVIAYLNLPYFAKQKEMQKEISSFLVAFINIYLFLLVLAIFMAFIISNYVTYPLQLIRDNLGKVQLGGLNEKIVWNRQDEIGNLINEYNHMIDQLSESVELLSKSERESAWREMAKQVAHEIKNPLTPMKLSVQYLEKAWKDKAPDWDIRLSKFTKTIVEQIDSLSVIATAFSDFAKMPMGKKECIELIPFLHSIPELYHGLENVNIKLDIKLSKSTHFILFDKQHLIRVFNNLIRNSIQAVEKDDNVYVDIIVSHENQNYLIQVKDNGKGIPQDLKQRIFSPNFTTKTGGTGLGLAMVKNMIELSGGTIWFESEFEYGTSFFISIPAYFPEKK